jgi:hypothetical protein
VYCTLKFSRRTGSIEIVFEIFDDWHSKVLKNSEQILDIDNKEFYSPAKPQREKACISAYTKITNPDISEQF